MRSARPPRGSRRACRCRNPSGRRLDRRSRRRPCRRGSDRVVCETRRRGIPRSPAAETEPSEPECSDVGRAYRPCGAFIESERIPASMRLTTIALVVSDAKKSAKWYTEKLGFEIREHQGHWITVAPKKENFAFHLCEGFYPLEPGNTGISFTTKDAKKEEESLRKLGVQFTTPTTKEDWGTYAMLKDPDGNEFYISEE